MATVLSENRLRAKAEAGSLWKISSDDSVFCEVGGKGLRMRRGEEVGGLRREDGVDWLLEDLGSGGGLGVTVRVPRLSEGP